MTDQQQAAAQSFLRS